MERHNQELKSKINIYMVGLFEDMEKRGWLNVHNPHQLGAVQVLGVAVLRVALLRFQAGYDGHVVRRDVGPAVGKPRDLRLTHPHPTGLRHSPAGMDYVRLYERATGRRQRRVPQWAEARDPLYNNPDAQAARAAAVMAVWGSVRDAWLDVKNNGGRSLFIPGYFVFLTFEM